MYNWGNWSLDLPVALTLQVLVGDAEFQYWIQRSMYGDYCVLAQLQLRKLTGEGDGEDSGVTVGIGGDDENGVGGEKRGGSKRAESSNARARWMESSTSLVSVLLDFTHPNNPLLNPFWKLLSNALYLASKSGALISTLPRLVTLL